MAFHTINGRSVAYRLLGAEVNPLIVLAHPLGMSQAVWDDVMPPASVSLSSTDLGSSRPRR